jgi:hypothetical protein
MGGGASNFLLDSGLDFLQIVVDRRDVETANLEPTLNALRQLLVNTSTVSKFRDRLDLRFAGYDEDSRELHQIEEVRKFVWLLDKEFPFWFYFINLRMGILIIIQLCLCRYTIREDRCFDSDPLDLADFLNQHFVAMNWLTEKCGLGEQLIELRTKEIIAFFDEHRKPSTIQ